MSLLHSIMPSRMEKIRVMVMEEHVEDLLRALQDLESVHLINMSERLMKW